MKLNKLYNETASQFIQTPEVAENFTPGLQNKISKVGVGMVVAALAFGTSGLAHADNILNAMIGAGGLGSLLIDGARPNLPPECQNLKGVNGYATMAGVATGAYAGNNIGGGSGKKAATLILGGLGGALVLGKQTRDIEEECNRQIQQINQARQSQYAQNNGGNNGYNNGNNNNGYNNNNSNNGYSNGYNSSGYTNSQGQPLNIQEPIFYEARDAHGRTVISTFSTSAGLQSLTGNRMGGDDIGTNPTIQRYVEQSLNTLNNDYKRLENISNTYMNLVNGRNSVEDRYSNIGNKSNSNSYHSRINSVIKDYSQAYATYVEHRGHAVLTLDNAAGIDNKNLSKYRDAAILFTPPQSAKITFYTAFQRELPTDSYPRGLQK